MQLQPWEACSEEGNRGEESASSTNSDSGIRRESLEGASTPEIELLLQIFGVRGVSCLLGISDFFASSGFGIETSLGGLLVSREQGESLGGNLITLLSGGLLGVVIGELRLACGSSSVNLILCSLLSCAGFEVVGDLQIVLLILTSVSFAQATLGFFLAVSLGLISDGGRDGQDVGESDGGESGGKESLHLLLSFILIIIQRSTRSNSNLALSPRQLSPAHSQHALQ